ncbi:DUF456 domain-containing protein [Pseudoneobacillus sp. C159]
MEILFWILIVAMFIVSFIGLIYPIIPGMLFIVGGFVLYGLFFTFQSLNVLFWSIQIMFIILLFSADYFANMIGVKKFGGSKAGVWGSTIGLLVGPFVIPVFGIIIGPFLGAVIAELLVHRKGFLDSIKIGVGSVIGFISSVVVKAVIQALMIGYFIYIVS